VSRTLFSGGTVVDGTGAPPAPADVLIEQGRIVAVGPGLDGDTAIDCTGQAVLPGLFDCHVHVTVDLATVYAPDEPFSAQFYAAARNLQATLDAGVTSVRDAGGADLGVKTARDRGWIAGPRMQVAINMLSQTGGHADGWSVCGAERPSVLGVAHPGKPASIVDGPDEVRRKVRELTRAGADVIKVATSGGVLSPRDDPRHAHFSPAELDVLVAEATAAGRFVMAHAHAADGIKHAVRAGVRSIEHGLFLDDEAIGLMLERGTWLVPTLAAPRAVLRALAGGADLPAKIVDEARRLHEVHTASIRAAADAGVRIAMGTDSGVGPHGDNLTELGLMAEVGMAPLDVLAATTSSAAALLGVDDRLGTLEPGKLADLVVVDGDPLDVTTLGERVRGVYQDGVLASSGRQGKESS
jgi:imidazolonepropionase-like amidohydrolase